MTHQSIKVSYNENAGRFNISMNAEDFARAYYSMNDFAMMTARDEVNSGRACGTAIIAVRDRLRTVKDSWEKQNHLETIEFLEKTSATCATSYGLLEGLFVAMHLFIERNIDLHKELGVQEGDPVANGAEV